jgi:phospholipase C
MRLTARILPLLALLTATFAYAQTTPNTPFQHVIIVIQENRTPDNLFGSDLHNNPRRLPNAHLASQGLCGTQEIPLQATGIDACFDPDHSHAQSTYFHGAWETMYVAGQPCNLQQVSWVIPDGSWSDHPGTVGADGGPSWVAAIVNAVGGYTKGGQKLPNQCTDTINGKQVPYWQDTVVLITWDDWGGFYDDVLPWNCLTNG